MNRAASILFKLAGSLLFTAASASCVWAQKPEVRVIDKKTSATGEIITIKGSSFGTDMTKIAVTFGAQQGQILSINNQSIEVKVPPGATYDNIAVTNLTTTNGLTGYAPDHFMLSYSGEHPFNIANLSAQIDFTSEKGLTDLQLVDLDNDGKNDIITANSGNNSISIFRNTSTVGNVSFTKTLFNVGFTTLTINTEDMNGDGLQDIVLIPYLPPLDKMFILQNNGGMSFTMQTLTITGNKNQVAEITDIDLDGKPEILLSDYTTRSDQTSAITILQNTSTTSTISFSPTLVSIPTTGVSTDDVIAEDMNGDGLPDIITTHYVTSSNSIYIIPNQSSPGSISFGPPVKIVINRTAKRFKIGDLDGDGKLDMAVSNLNEDLVSLYRNTGTGSTISFATPIITSIPSRPWGIDFGDMDGDGKADIIIAHAVATKLTILNNQSTPGTLLFTNQSVNTTYRNRHIKAGDIDGDGKPDLAFTSVDPDASTVVSRVSIFRNRSCVVPKLSPATTPVTICSNLLPYQLQATPSPGSTYEWFKDGVTLGAGNNGVDKNVLMVTSAMGSGDYTVRITQEGGTCSKTSLPIEINIGASGNTTNPGPISNSPVCEGSALNLNITTPIAGATYKWTGPNGFTSTTANPTLTDFRLINAGTYTVDVIDNVAGGCVSSKTSIVVEAVDVPTFKIGGPETVVFCSGSTTLNVVPSPGSFTYQWLKDGAPIGTGATSPSITAIAASTGNYTVKASNAGCAGLNIETDPVHIKVATAPTANFSFSPTPNACAGQKVTFTNGSTIDNSTTAFYNWTFGDGGTSTAANPEHTYVTANSYDINLSVSYANGACLTAATQQSITVTAAVVPNIINTTTAGKFNFCEGESVTFGVTGSNITSYTWSTGATTPTITLEVSDDDNISVEVLSNGCNLNDVQAITAIPGPTVLVSSTPEKINEGETAQLSADGITTFNWTPIETIESGATTANPIVKPLVTTTYTVTGSDAGGCEGSATIEVRVLGEAIVSKLKPKAFFSPNGSPPNDTWVVGDITSYPQCNVVVYDDKGVKVFEAKPYNNDWDGTFNGKKLPDGVYFYIIRCEGEEDKPRTGSISILR